MQAHRDYTDGMKRIQYTIRNVPLEVDSGLRSLAVREGNSLNETLIRNLNRGLGLAETPARFNDLDDLAGTWADDPEFDKAVEEMHRIDEGLWK